MGYVERGSWSIYWIFVLWGEYERYKGDSLPLSDWNYILRIG
jgi:hypothetical protein